MIIDFIYHIPQFKVMEVFNVYTSFIKMINVNKKVFMPGYTVKSGRMLNLMKKANGLSYTIYKLKGTIRIDRDDTYVLNNFNKFKHYPYIESSAKHSFKNKLFNKDSKLFKTLNEYFDVLGKISELYQEVKHDFECVCSGMIRQLDREHGLFNENGVDVVVYIGKGKDAYSSNKYHGEYDANEEYDSEAELGEYLVKFCKK